MVSGTFSLDIGGATLAGLETGEGLPVVFLHAGVCDKRMWESQMAGGGGGRLSCHRL